MKIVPRNRIGHFARVSYEDVNEVRDGIILDVNEDRTVCTFFELGKNGIINDRVFAHEVVAFGNSLAVTDTGLDT